MHLERGLTMLNTRKRKKNESYPRLGIETEVVSGAIFVCVFHHSPRNRNHNTKESNKNAAVTSFSTL